MNKLFAGISILFFSTSLVKCTYTYEEIKPLDEDMGEWDGNYIYKGNIRVKCPYASWEIFNFINENISNPLSIINELNYWIGCFDIYKSINNLSFKDYAEKGIG